jgi:hypothetical protein
MKYYISDTPLKLKEYGRNVQSMVEYAKTIEDKEERNKVVQEIVRIMANLNPNVRELPDYEQKLWDNLFMIADFDLDVDAPFPVPSPEEVLGHKSERLSYFKPKPRYRQYGYNTELMVRKAVEMPDGEEKTAFINYIATIMRQLLRDVDRESTPEETLAAHLNEMSKGKLQLKGSDLTVTRTPGKLKLPPEVQRAQQKQKSRRSKSSRKNIRKRRK